MGRIYHTEFTGIWEYGIRFSDNLLSEIIIEKKVLAFPDPIFPKPLFMGILTGLSRLWRIYVLTDMGKVETVFLISS